MHIDTAALAAAITRACAELDRLDAAAAEGPIGRLDGRLLLRIEPDREHRAGREIPLPPGGEAIVSAATPDADERDPPGWHGVASGWDLDNSEGDTADIRSPRNACRHRDTCRELLLALQLIVENPDHELLTTERADAEAAIAQATGKP